LQGFSSECYITGDLSLIFVPKGLRKQEYG
jgi:hypothetical protein